VSDEEKADAVPGAVRDIIERRFFARMMGRQGIRNPCSVCSGYGNREYPSTATWRGGVGARAVTLDVCDGCWGSGDADRSWTDIRRLIAKIS